AQGEGVLRLLPVQNERRSAGGPLLLEASDAGHRWSSEWIAGPRRPCRRSARPALSRKRRRNRHLSGCQAAPILLISTGKSSKFRPAFRSIFREEPTRRYPRRFFPSAQ